MTTLFRAVMLIFVLIEPVLAQSSAEKEYECLSLLAILPIIVHPAMQELSKTEQDSTVLVKKTLDLAQQGVADAQLSVARFLHSGYCLPKDAPRALDWYTKAAENGSALAQHQLGESYLFGKVASDPMQLDVPQDSAIGLRWLNMAAEQGDKEAQWGLARVYSIGREGVPQDLLRAYMWYAVLGVKTELEKLTQKMTASQVEDAQHLAKDWIQKHPQRVR